MPCCKKAPLDSYRWFRNARFGLFVHYGLYSLLGRHEWSIYNERIPFQEYLPLAQRFNPRPSSVSEWVALAKAAGMRYMCLTTRHHEGFALFDTRASDFNALNSPARRDLVREYVEACRKAGLGVGLYYSVANWNDPGWVAGPVKDPKGWRQFVSVLYQQLVELMSNYGKINYLFFDGTARPKHWRATEILAEIRRLQPGILISRTEIEAQDDVYSAERKILSNTQRCWESCMTTNDSWGYNRGDHHWKTPWEIVQYLLACAHNGGNYLLNVGPMADGRVPATAVRLLRQVGQWLKRNGDAVYGTDPHPFDYADQKLSTGRDCSAYIPLNFYYGPQTIVAGIGNRVRRVRILSTGRRVAFRQKSDRVFVTGLPDKAPDSPMTVLAFDLDGKPRGVPNPRASTRDR